LHVEWTVLVQSSLHLATLARRVNRPGTLVLASCNSCMSSEPSWYSRPCILQLLHVVWTVLVHSSLHLVTLACRVNRPGTVVLPFCNSCMSCEPSWYSRPLSSLVYPVTLLRKRISAASRPVMSLFVVTHVSLPYSSDDLATTLQNLICISVRFSLSVS